MNFNHQDHFPLNIQTIINFKVIDKIIIINNQLKNNKVKFKSLIKIVLLNMLLRNIRFKKNKLLFMILSLYNWKESKIIILLILKSLNNKQIKMSFLDFNKIIHN